MASKTCQSHLKARSPVGTRAVRALSMKVRCQTEKFVVLRDAERSYSGPSTDNVSPDWRPGFGSVLKDVPPRPTLEIVDASQADRRDLASDPGVLHFIRPMPLKLVEPVIESQSGGALSAAPGSHTWGLTATKAESSQCIWTGGGIKVRQCSTYRGVFWPVIHAKGDVPLISAVEFHHHRSTCLVAGSHHRHRCGCRPPCL